MFALNRSLRFQMCGEIVSFAIYFPRHLGGHLISKADIRSDAVGMQIMS